MPAAFARSAISLPTISAAALICHRSHLAPLRPRRSEEAAASTFGAATGDDLRVDVAVGTEHGQSDCLHFRDLRVFRDRRKRVSFLVVDPPLLLLRFFQGDHFVGVADAFAL